MVMCQHDVGYCVDMSTLCLQPFIFVRYFVNIIDFLDSIRLLGQRQISQRLEPGKIRIKQVRMAAQHHR